MPTTGHRRAVHLLQAAVLQVLQVRPARQRATVLQADLPAVRRAPEALPAVATVHPGAAAAGVPHQAQDALPLAEAAGLRADAQEDSLNV